MITAVYSILHFLVDGICAVSMFGIFSSSPNFVLYLLLYNFCAFALQMPFGALVDLLLKKHEKKAAEITLYTAGLGVLLTAVGAIVNPVILGIGNGLFHVGGGVSTIREDFEKNLKGRALGIFVAPGALGLYLGTVLGKMNLQKIMIAVVILALVFFSFSLFIFSFFYHVIHGKKEEKVLVAENTKSLSGLDLGLLVLCVFFSFLVVILRSFTGFAVSFQWKEGFLLGLLATLMAVLGKMGGGLLAAQFGEKRVVLFSLLLAGAAFLFKDAIPVGLLAVLFFNMTMPITLYVLVRSNPLLSGFFFGLLTFALFLGYLPSYFGMSIPLDGGWIGFISSIISFVLLFSSVWILEMISKRRK